MDSEEVALDWGGNEDEETIFHQEEKIQGQPRKDEATLSLVVESLLALRQTSGPDGDDQEDRYSDAVSLGGGDEDDMEQLHAYQSRTHLGGVSSTDRKSAQPSQKSSQRTNNEERRHRRSSVTRSPPPSSYSNSPRRAPDEQTSRFGFRDRRSRSKAQHEERTDSHSLHRLPTGSLALPPRPTGPITAPFVHPSNPAMMSASSMAPASRERDRDAPSGDRRVQQASDDDLSLAPNWEVRLARDGSGDQYYYNTKTHESTWNRSVATGSDVNKLSSSDSVKDQDQVPGRRSTPPPRSLNGNQQRSRPLRDDGLAPGSPPIAFKDRHYSPPVVVERDDGRSQRPVAGDSRIRKRSPSPHVTAYPDSYRGNDRDIQTHNRREREERPPFRVNLNGERRVGGSRSRSPVRGQWRNDAVAPASWDRVGRGPPSDDRRGEAVRRSGPVSPSRDSFRTRASSLGRDIGARYTPNHEQSSFRDRRRSPPLPPPQKRTRSKSPDNRRLVTSQPIASGRRWEEPDRPRDNPHPYSGPPRDRLPQVSDPPLFNGQRRERPTRDDRSIDAQDPRSRNFDMENEVKRRRTSDHPDSAPARRYKGNDDREYANEDHLSRKRAPLPPQEERFKEVTTSGPPPVGFSRNVPSRDGPALADPPQHMPPPPPVRKMDDPREPRGPGRSPGFHPSGVPGSDRYYARDRATRDRDRERNSPPDVSWPTRGIKEPEGFDRRGPPPDRSPAMTPMLIPSDAYRAREAREERLSVTHSRSFNNVDRGPSQQSRSAGPRMDEPLPKERYNRPPPHQARPPFNTSSSSSGMPSSLPNRGRELDTPRDMRDTGPNDRNIQLGVDRGEPSKNMPFPGRRRSSSFSKGPIDDFTLNSAKPRASFSPQVPMRPSPENGRPRARTQSFQEQQPAPFSPQEKPPSRWGPGGGSRPTLERSDVSEAPGVRRRPSSPLLTTTSSLHENPEFERPTSRSPLNTTSFRPPSQNGPPRDSYNHNQAPGRYSGEKDPPPTTTKTSVPPTMHPERMRLINNPPPPPPPPPPGRGVGPAGRGRRPYNSEDNRPPDVPPPLVRQGSLLDRISNPTPPASSSDTFPSLRERVSGPPDNRKAGGGQWPRGNPNVPLRDRLEDSNVTENEVSHNNRRGNGNGSWRGSFRENTRGRRGRGQ